MKTLKGVIATTTGKGEVVPDESDLHMVPWFFYLTSKPYAVEKPTDSLVINSPQINGLSFKAQLIDMSAEWDSSSVDSDITWVRFRSVNFNLEVPPESANLEPEVVRISLNRVLVDIETPPESLSIEPNIARINFRKTAIDFSWEDEFVSIEPNIARINFYEI